MKIYRFTILLCSLLLSISVLAQNPKEKAIYDSLTYYYSQNSEWDSVIDIGKESIYKGYDFYILRMRMGQAYDNQNNYRLSEIQYTKALEFDSLSENAAFYKYHAAINGGRQGVAYYYYKKSSPEQKKLILGDKPSNSKYPEKTKIINQISLFTGISFTNNADQSDDILELTPGLLSNQTNIRTQQYYAHFGIKGNISPLWSWNFIYNYNQINGKHLFREKNYPAEGNNITSKQNEFFGSISTFLGDGWNITAYGLFLNYNIERYFKQVGEYNYYITAENDSILGTNPDFVDYHTNFKDNSFVGGLKIKKTIDILDLSFMANYSEFNSSSPYQFTGEINLLPGGNYDFYLSNRITFSENHTESKWIYKISIGGRTLKSLHYFASGTFGDLHRTNELDYGVVYNLSEPTTFKGEAGLSYPLSNKLWISLHYQIYQKEVDLYQEQLENFFPSQDFPGYFEPYYSYSFDTYKFNEHFVYLGFVWSL